MLRAIKKELILLSALGMLCTIAVANPVKLKGAIKNVNTPYIYIFQYFGPELTKVDSVKHTKGEFQLKAKDLPKGFYKIGESEEKSAMLILGEDDITINVDLELPTSLNVANSKENGLYVQFTNFNEKHNEEISKINQEAQKLAPLQYNNSDQYAAEINKLQKRVDSLNLNQKSFYKGIITTNPETIMAKFVSMFEFPDNITKENFFKDGELSDASFTKGEALASKINYYFQKFAPATIEGWKEAAGEILPRAAVGSKNKEVVYLTLIKMFLPYDDAYSRTLAKSYLAEYPESPYAKKIIARLPKGAPGVGEMATDIKLEGPTGQKLALSSLKGKVVLLDFWASWCGPCRKENPNVVKLYNEYKDKGFTVFSVSLDNNKDNWIQAIQADQLVWNTHVSDLKGWKSAPAAQYGVKAIPQTFLIGRDGKVLAVNLRGDQLETALKELFK